MKSDGLDDVITCVTLPPYQYVRFRSRNDSSGNLFFLIYLAPPSAHRVKHAARGHGPLAANRCVLFYLLRPQSAERSRFVKSLESPNPATRKLNQCFVAGDSRSPLLLWLKAVRGV